MDIILVDGHAIAYRSYYAFIKNPLTNSRGENTSAVFGFTRVIRQIIGKFEPRHLAVVFDSDQPTKRHSIYPQYKAQRDKMPEELSKQIPVIRELVEAMGISTFTSPGYEADDIIATIALRAQKGDMEVGIVSGDKDMFQLLSDRINLIRPSKGVNLSDRVGPEYIKSKYGLNPSQIKDYLALVGDSSDNIPGVRGIGEKTAVKLLLRYGSLDNIIKNTGDISPGHVGKKLEEGSKNALFSRRLVELMEVPEEFPLDAMEPGEMNTARLTEILVDLDMHQVLKEILPESGPEEEAVRYRVVDRTGLKDLEKYLRSRGEFVLDVETTSLSPLEAGLVGISFCVEEGEAFYVPVEDDSERGGATLFEEKGPGSSRIRLEGLKSVLGGLLADEDIGKIGHNIKYDLMVLSKCGVEVKGVTFDTMIASYCLDPSKRSHSLDNLVLEFCQHRMIAYNDLFDKRDRIKDIREVALKVLGEYACEDSDYTMRLKNMFSGMLDDSSLEGLFEDIEMPLLFVLMEMEMTGVALDLGQLKEMSRRISEKLYKIEKKIFEQAGGEFNINSNKQLQEILFEKLKLPVVKKTKTGYSTDMEVLSELSGEHPIAALIIEHRQLSKLSNTYIETLPKLVNSETGRIHTSFNQTVTSTGRLSSSNPNLQNIPIRSELGREIRKAFVPEKGNILMDADYSQVELRILAHLSKDRGLIKAFREEADIHTRTAATIFQIEESEVDADKRAIAKTINFGVIYGQGPRALSRQIGVSFEEAGDFIEGYFEKYPDVKGFIEGYKELAREKGFAETMFGRRRYLPDIKSEDSRLRSFSERIAVNTPIQGTAADMIKIAMIEISGAIDHNKLGSRMILQVHDELVFEVPMSERDVMLELVRSKMESAVKLDVPLTVSIGTGASWLEAH